MNNSQNPNISNGINNTKKSYHVSPPPARVLPVLKRVKEAYRLWHKSISNLTRVDRYTIGVKIDDIFLSLLELIYKSCFASDKFEKLSLVSQAITKCDLLKFFMQIVWEQKIIDHKKYEAFIILLDEIGRMLGGWKKNVKNKNSR